MSPDELLDEACDAAIELLVAVSDTPNVPPEVVAAAKRAAAAVSALSSEMLARQEEVGPYCPWCLG